MSIVDRIKYYKQKIAEYINYDKLFVVDSKVNISPQKQKNLISFSLYGDKDLYLIGSLKNIELSAKIYPDWILRFYLAQDVNEKIKYEIASSGAEMVIMQGTGVDNRFMLWRFLSAADPDVYATIIRDTDSRFTIREKLLVDEWLNSACDFHIIRDHPFHYSRIMGGLWGVKNHLLQDIDKYLISYFSRVNSMGVDQKFLTERIYPVIKEHAMIHDSQHLFKDEAVAPMKMKRDNENYIGQIIEL